MAAFPGRFSRRPAGTVYRSTERTLAGMPGRGGLIQRPLYLAPNSIVVSRGCPHACDFCYKESFFRGGRSFYTQAVDAALAEIESLPGRHLFFLDDNLFGSPRFAAALFDGMRGMGRVWQAAATVGGVLRPACWRRRPQPGCAACSWASRPSTRPTWPRQGKWHNLGRDYAAAIRRLHDLGVMINASFVFGMDEDDASVFERTVAWAMAQGIETATFHILTPYPGTALHERMAAAGRSRPRLEPLRHATRRLPTGADDPGAMEAGYWDAYRQFYTWPAIFRSAWTQADRADGCATWPTWAAGRSAIGCGMGSSGRSG